MKRLAQKPPKYKVSKRFVIITCGLVTVFSLTAFAYNITYGFTKSPYSAHVNSEVPAVVMEETGNTVQKTIEENGLTITIKNTVSDNKMMYINLDIQSKDGTPITESSEFRKSMLPRDRFAESNMKIGDQTYPCYMFRKDDGSALDKASYECQVFGDFTNQSGETVTLVLKDLKDTVRSGEDAGFLFDNLGELYETIIPEKPENFIKTGLYQDHYADESIVCPSWTIPAGTNHVDFSSQFPNSYIDNIGFHKTGEYGCEMDMLYISIVPGNDGEATALKELCFQNLTTMNFADFGDYMITGFMQVFDRATNRYVLDQAELDSKISYNNGRIVIALDLMADSNTFTRDCTVQDLYNYRIMKNFKEEELIRCPGEWSIPFELNFTDTTREYKPNQTKTVGNTTATINNVSISDLSISLDGVVTSDVEKLSISTKLIMNDGTVVDVGPKVGGGFDLDHKFEVEGNLTTLVHADDVVAIEIFGMRFDLK